MMKIIGLAAVAVTLALWSPGSAGAAPKADSVVKNGQQITDFSSQRRRRVVRRRYYVAPYVYRPYYQPYYRPYYQPYYRPYYRPFYGPRFGFPF